MNAVVLYFQFCRKNSGINYILIVIFFFCNNLLFIQCLFNKRCLAKHKRLLSKLLKNLLKNSTTNF